jgi:hypothetical protein
MASSKHVDLFGGAIGCTLPSHWRDVSTIRQVPDNQEVYQDCTEQTGAVMVVEILQYQDDVKNDDAARFFFGDLADSNGCGDGDSILESSRVFDDAVSSNDEEKSEDHVVHNILNTIKQSSAKNCCVIAVGSQRVIQGKAYTGAGTAAEKRIRVEMCIMRLENVETDLLITLSAPSDEPSAGVSDHFRNILSGFLINDWTLFG